MELLNINMFDRNFKSPLMTASGTSGHSGEEISNLKNNKKVFSCLGAFVTKGVTLKPKSGNDGIRIAESSSGILNSIGLQNEGVEYFVNKEIPKLIKLNIPIFINISASSIEDFGRLAAYLSEHIKAEIVEGLEINVSCPNISKGGLAFGTDPKQVEKVVKKVRENVCGRFKLITKLTPNVIDITESAKAAIAGGTDALSMINTLRGMVIDIETKKPLLGNKVGGLSGPAIKPVGLYMVYECFEKIIECNKRKIPIIGIGGISNWQDALQYIMAGASAVGVGTAWMVSPGVFTHIHDGLFEYLKMENQSISNLIGVAHSN